ncbi:MAG: GrpB family protein [Clostridia bacterium]|nr:GrpB family protein [Clostridia bacterium]
MLGLRRGTVVLYPHETEWEEEAARTIACLKAILGDAARDIQHVGSTAVRSIMAKPIVDIAVAADDFDRVLAKREPLERAGFYYRPGSLEGQLLFARGSFYDGTGDLQTHFIHVVKAGGADWFNYIRFRDYLNACPTAAKAYEDLKVSLARECPVDAGRERYLAGKYDFIRRTLRDAAAWAFLGRKVRIVIDRPIGYVHRTGGFETVYPVNYGYLPGVPGGDGEEQDAYLLGVDKPVAEADAVVIGVVRRHDDAEDKLIAAPEGVTFTKEQMAEAVRFQEQWFDSEIL